MPAEATLVLSLELFSQVGEPLDVGEFATWLHREQHAVGCRFDPV